MSVDGESIESMGKQYIYIYFILFYMHIELQYTCVCNSFLDSRRFRNIAAGNL